MEYVPDEDLPNSGFGRFVLHTGREIEVTDGPDITPFGNRNFADSLPEDLTPDERIEIASYAAGLWQKWAAQNPKISHG